MTHSRPYPAFKVWMETEDGYVFGPGVYSLLKKIMSVGTLKEASTELGMSYRYAWGLIKKAEEKLGEPLLSAHKGGKSGGGGAELTKRAKIFLTDFENLREQMRRVSESPPQLIASGTVKDVKTTQRQIEITLLLTLAENVPFRKGEHVNILKNE